MKQRRLYNIRGYQGSGKSTIIFELIQKYNKQDITLNNKVIATKLEKKKLICIGKYHTKCGGADSLKQKKNIVNAIIHVIKNYADYDIILEGMFISTSKYYLKLFLYLQQKYNIKPIVIFLTTSPANCINNVKYKRGGNLKYDKSSYKAVLKQYYTFKQYLTTYTIDNNNITKKELLNKFLEITKK